LRWRQWLMDTELDDSISGRVMEYSWHSKYRCLFVLSHTHLSHWTV